MEKEQNQDIKKDEAKDVALENGDQNLENEKDDKSKPIEKTPEEKILELEDKVSRTFAEMENQRRRYEKEKDDAFEYGGFIFKLQK